MTWVWILLISLNALNVILSAVNVGFWIAEKSAVHEGFKKWYGRSNW